MAETSKSTVRKGRIYHLQVADADYRAFIWQTGTSFCGRVEDHPQVPLCRGRTVVVVREQLREALAASLKG
ncbi:MAG TPA: hypothetical protein PKD53_18740 [Chloroflexaceae bacterium]|nr:hypothetical protein [Chloroflexaceae bacterium]